MGIQLSVEQRRRLRRLRADGMTVAEVAREIGCSLRTVKRVTASRAGGSSGRPAGARGRRSLWDRRLLGTVVTCNMIYLATPQENPDVKARVRDHRARLRAQGLRPIQIWVPDVRSPRFAEEAHRQSTAVASSIRAADDQAFIDALSSDEA